MQQARIDATASDGQAAAEVSGAHVTGAELGSSDLHFVPGRIMGGAYHFAIGSAGSCTLVLQTIVLALLFAAEPSRRLKAAILVW